MNAIIESAVSGLLGAIIGAVSSYQLLQYRVHQLEKKAEEHDSKLKAAEQRIEDKLQRLAEDTTTIKLELAKMNAFQEGVRAKNT